MGKDAEMVKNTIDAALLVREFAQKGITVGTAESCTGGLVAKLITDVAGSSQVLLGGFVTYTNEVKTRLLGVDPGIFARDTEVSFACAEAMAAGARERLGATLAVSLTGFAGPTGGTDADPVGTVYIGIASARGVRSERFQAPDPSTRESVRNAAAVRALELLYGEGRLLVN